MIISTAIVVGFKSEIRNKVIGFGSHIQVVNYDLNTSYETKPINKNQDFYPDIDTIKGINHIQVFGTKAGIIKTETDIQGVVLKGIGSNLLNTIISFSKNKYNITKIYLEDESIRYRKQNNIYKKFGFNYIFKYEKSMYLKV